MLFSLSWSNLIPEGNFFGEDAVGADDGKEMLLEVGGLFLASGVRESHDHFTMTVPSATLSTHAEYVGVRWQCLTVGTNRLYPKRVNEVWK